MAVLFKTPRRRCGRLRRMTSPDINAATSFLAANARGRSTSAASSACSRAARPGLVRAAVAAYRNGDGGFGHALEPDGRTPDSQPAAVEVALRILNEADAWDHELVRGALDWLQQTAPAEGGAVFVAPGRRGLAPRAVVGPAGGAPGLTDLHRPYRGHPPCSRGRAPAAHAEHRAALDADRPARRSRTPTRCFNWPAWSPAAELDWRGSITVDALRVLAANGRWSGEVTAAASHA